MYFKKINSLPLYLSHLLKGWQNATSKIEDQINTHIDLTLTNLENTKITQIQSCLDTFMLPNGNKQAMISFKLTLALMPLFVHGFEHHHPFTKLEIGQRLFTTYFNLMCVTWSEYDYYNSTWMER